MKLITMNVTADIGCPLGKILYLLWFQTFNAFRAFKQTSSIAYPGTQPDRQTVRSRQEGTETDSQKQSEWDIGRQEGKETETDRQPARDR